MADPSLNMHMLRDLIKGLEEHAQRTETVYQQQIDILKARLLDRDEQIHSLFNELLLYRDTPHTLLSAPKDQHFESPLEESRNQLALLIKSKMEHFEQAWAPKTHRSQSKNQLRDLTPQLHKKLLMEIAQLRNDKETHERQLEAQSKLIQQYEEEELHRTKEVREMNKIKNRTKSQSKSETKKIIDLYTKKYKQLVCNYSSFFSDLTAFMRNELELLKKETIEGLTGIWETVASCLTRLTEEGSQKDPIGTLDVSSINREDVLEFQLQQLRKELLSLKAQNCVMKFHIKRTDDKNKPLSKTHLVFDKNKFFEGPNSENSSSSSQKVKNSRISEGEWQKGDLKGDPKSDLKGDLKSGLKSIQGDVKEMDQLRERVKMPKNPWSGRTSGSKGGKTNG